MVKGKANVVFGTAILVCLILSRVLGTQGKMVLLGVALFGVAVMMLGGLLLSLYFGVSKTMRKGAVIWTLVVGILLLGYGVFSETGVVRDLVEGTKVENLTSCSISSRTGIHGILGNRWYLNGIDKNGKLKVFPISIAAHNELEGRMNVTVECYQHTGRIVIYY